MAKHIGSLSYTEDDILIYSIYVLPPLKTSYESKLLEYFTKFGDVENLDMLKEKKYNCVSTSAVIRFKNPESASKALRHKTHKFCDRIIYVKSALSCNQPYQTKLTTSGEINNPNNIYTILKLNDDCLLLIFQYLSLQDQYNLSTLCTRMENIYESSIKMKKSIRIVKRDISNIHCLPIVLEKVGHNIQCITFCSSVEDLSLKNNLNLSLNYLPTLCQNLYQLKFDGVFLKYNDFTNFTSLRHIELKEGCLDDDMILKLTNLSNIKYLDLTSNKNITGLYLHKFYNLETLILNSCYDIESKNFVKICSTIKNLKELNINHCDKLNSNAINALIDNLNVLEILTICMDLENVNYENIPKLKNLKHLTINEAYWNGISLLKQLAKEKTNQLETLKIGQFIYDDQKGIAIKQLKKLKQLDLPDAEYFKNEFFNDLSNLHDLKFLNIPKCENINYEIVLDYLNKAPITLEKIDLYDLQCDEEFVLRASKILKLKNRPKPLTLTLKCTKIIKKTFVEDDMVILKIKNTENNYDYVKKFSKIKIHNYNYSDGIRCRHDEIVRQQRMGRENRTS